MTAVDTTLRHLSSRLRGSAALTAAVGGRIYEGVVPETDPNVEVEYPLVLVQIYGNPDTITYNGGSVAHHIVEVSVRVVSDGDTIGPLLPIAQAVHVALHDTHGTYPSGEVTSCHQTNETTFTEIEGGRTYRYLGGLYRLTIS